MTTEQTFIKDLVILTPKLFNDSVAVFLKLTIRLFYENGIKHDLFKTISLSQEE
jgi:hypothetical protein